jgi:type I restriction enzyme S subunit
MVRFFQNGSFDSNHSLSVKYQSMNTITRNTTFQKYPAYKDSGVEWLGEIPEGWTLGKLGTLLKPVSIKGKPDLPLLSITRELGVIERNLDEDEGNHNFIPDDLSGYKVIQKGQFGMNKMKAWQGSYGISQFTGIISPAYYVFDFTSEIDPRFFHFAIRSNNYVAFFGKASDGVRIGQWDLSKSRMKEIPFFIPSPPEQTAIATFLDDKTAKIDRAIAQKEQLIALLKERKQIIIQNAVTKGLDPDVKMKDSGVEWIGEIPEHWEVTRLGYHMNVLSGYAFPSSGFTNAGVKLLRGINVGVDKIRWDETVFWPDTKIKGLEQYFLKAGDIVVGMDRPLIGKGMRVSNIEENDLPCLLLQRVTRLQAHKKLSQEYLALILQNQDFVNYFLPILSGVSVPHISPTQIQEYPIGLPSKVEQEQIIQFVNQESTKIDQAISLQQTQIEKLKEYKATLIDSAVTGKINVTGV